MEQQEQHQAAATDTIVLSSTCDGMQQLMVQV